MLHRESYFSWLIFLNTFCTGNYLNEKQIEYLRFILRYIFFKILHFQFNSFTLHSIMFSPSTLSKHVSTKYFLCVYKWQENEFHPDNHFYDFHWNIKVR